jgi:hypothetical protein
MPLRSLFVIVAVLALGLGLGLGLGGCLMPAEKPLPAMMNNYCQDEAITWLKKRFGDDIQILSSRIDKSGIQEKEVKGWRVLVWIDRCDGYFTVDYGVRSTAECTTPQMGERDRLLLMVGAVGDCRRLLPRMEHPR